MCCNQWIWCSQARSIEGRLSLSSRWDFDESKSLQQATWLVLYYFQLSALIKKLIFFQRSFIQWWSSMEGATEIHPSSLARFWLWQKEHGRFNSRGNCRSHGQPKQTHHQRNQHAIWGYFDQGPVPCVSHQHSVGNHGWSPIRSRQ